MKNILLLLWITFASLSSNAQTVLDKYDGQDNVSSVIVNKKMFELMSKVKMESKEDQAYLNLIKKLENLRVFKTSSAKITSDMKTTVEKYKATAGLEDLMRVNESGKNAKIYVKSAGNTQIKELLMFVEGTGVKGSDTVLMSLTGDFDINEISLLTKRMNLPGGEILNDATKK